MTCDLSFWAGVVAGGPLWVLALFAAVAAAYCFSVARGGRS